MPEMPTYEELLAQNNYLKNHAKYQAAQLAEKDKKIQQLEKQNKELEINYNWILEQLKLSKRQKFGSSAESIIEGYEQINLFNEAEAERTAFKPEPTVEEVIKKSKNKKKSIKDKYKNLEVEEIIHALSDEEKNCDICGSEMSFMRYDISHKIKIIPAKAILEVHKTEVYVCKECDKNGTEGSFKTAQTEPSLIEKSLATPSFMAYILNQKFCLGLPLYRQEQELRRMNIYLSRQTMANWVIAAAKMLKPLYDKLHKNLVERKILHADETTLEVLKLPDRDTPLNAYMWVYRTSRFEECPIVLYDYEEGRSGSYAKEFLRGFSGYLHCDGWGGYDKVENIKRVGCWVHVRRKFYDALKIQADPKDYSTIAGQAFLMIEKLFETERISPDKPSELTEYSLEKITEARKNISTKILDEFFDFCDKNQGVSLPKSLTGTAITYALNQKETLMTFLDDPKLELSNNAAERAVKPFVIGRRNFLFCNTPNGANSSAVIYSIIETAKENGLKPFEYLEFLFENIRVGNDVAELVPWSERITDNLKLKSIV